MVFGFFVGVPLLIVPFVLILKFRRRLAASIGNLGLPRMALYLLLSVRLIIFEEQIDCQSAWCGQVIIPPTLPFLFVELLVVGAIVLLIHAKNVFRITLAFCVYGILFELFLGGLRGAPLLWTLLLVPYVGLGYAFISMLPLTVLLERGR